MFDGDNVSELSAPDLVPADPTCRAAWPLRKTVRGFARCALQPEHLCRSVPWAGAHVAPVAAACACMEADGLETPSPPTCPPFCCRAASMSRALAWCLRHADLVVFTSCGSAMAGCVAPNLVLPQHTCLATPDSAASLAWGGGASQPPHKPSPPPSSPLRPQLRPVRPVLSRRQAHTC